MTQPLEEDLSPLATPSTDRCPNCNARMAPDQRYCVECGERRSGGGLRDALPKTPTPPPAPKTRRTFGATPSSTLIAGIATLLLAMGVGVLIGRSGDHGTSKAASATPQVVTVQTSGAAGGAATTAAAAAGGAAVTKAAKATHHHKKKSAPAATPGASSVQKTAAKNGVKLPPPVVKVGGKCQAGAKGCSGGKFTGNFFGQ